MATQQKQDEQGLTRPDASILSSPFSAMRRLSDEMERLFEGAWFPEARWPRLWHSPDVGESWSPKVDMFERGKQLVVRADLPGLTKDDVKVEVADSELLIAGERKTEKEEKREGYYRKECAHGSFSRSIRLPEGVEADAVKASFKNGVLEVTMPAPKHPEKHGRRVAITS